VNLTFSVGGNADLFFNFHHFIPALLKDAQTAAADFLARRDREQRRHYARSKPKSIGNVIAQVLTARGYGRIQADTNFAAAWQTAIGPALAKFTLPGRLRRGVLEITVANSMTVQELTFQKQQILKQLQTNQPDAKIRDLRFRIGSIK
jgi:predicted nucleic acid-binding Zn ribbon protein